MELDGEEGISALTWFEALAVLPLDHSADEVLDRLPGEPTTLTLGAASPTPRYLHCDIVRVASTGELAGSGRHGLRLRLEDRCHRLRYRTTSRVFQDTDTKEVVSGLLTDHRVKFEWRLSTSPPRREHIVQYRESDLDLFLRLLAEEGIMHWHEHHAESSVLVLSDSANGYDTTETTLYARSSAEQSSLTRAHSTAFEVTVQRRLAPDAVVARRYDINRPQYRVDEQANVVEGGKNTTALTPITKTARTIAAQEVYSHSGASRSSSQHLLQLRRDARVAKGRCDAFALAAGCFMSLRDHLLATANGHYVVVTVKHRLTSDDETPYSNEFIAVDRGSTYPPPPAIPRRIDALEAATVVGPEPDVVHCDNLGRVKVVFHWERGDVWQTKGAWVRVAQAWAGRAMGGQFLPRVGSEVAVAFLGGSGDQPVIVGALHNGIDTMPFLPDETPLKSGFRSRSPTGTGYSELSFDDTEDQETVSLVAQRDMSFEAAGSLRHNVKGDASSIVQGDQAATTSGFDRVHVAKSRSVNVAESETRSIGGDSVANIEGASSVRVHGGTSLETSDASLHVKRGLSAVASEMTFFADDAAGVGRINISAASSCSVTSGARVTVAAEEAIVLSCGESLVEIRPDGIRIATPKLDVESSVSTSLRSKGAALGLSQGFVATGGSVLVSSGGASLLLDADAHLDGALVKLNCGGEGGGPQVDTDEDDSRKLRVTPLLRSGGTCAGWDYLLIGEGLHRRGVVPADGEISSDVEPDIRRATLRLTSPEGVTHTINLHVTSKPELSTLEGVQQALSNLGFFLGAADGIASEQLRLALDSFRRLMGIDADPELREDIVPLDDATRSAIAKQLESR